MTAAYETAMIATQPSAAGKPSSKYISVPPIPANTTAAIRRPVCSLTPTTPRSDGSPGRGAAKQSNDCPTVRRLGRHHATIDGPAVRHLVPRVRLGGDDSAIEGEVLLVIAGAASALFGQALTHGRTIRRERRADMAHAVDRAVSAFGDGESALDDVTDAIKEWQAGGIRTGDDESVEAALTQAERTRVQMRASVFSLRLRVGDESSQLYRTFDRAWDEWEIGLEKAKVILRQRAPTRDSLRDVRGHASEFRGLFYDRALEEAAQIVARRGIGSRLARRVMRRARWARIRQEPERSHERVVRS